MELSSRIMGVRIRRESPGWRNEAGSPSLQVLVDTSVWREIAQTKERSGGEERWPPFSVLSS